MISSLDRGEYKLGTKMKNLLIGIKSGNAIGTKLYLQPVPVPRTCVQDKISTYFESFAIVQM